MTFIFVSDSLGNSKLNFKEIGERKKSLDLKKAQRYSQKFN